MSEKNHAAAGVAASQLTTPCAPEGFEVFFRESYRELVRAVMTAGATLEEAEDSVSDALVSMLRRWPSGGFPLRYARKAVIFNYIKYKTRSTRHVSGRGLTEDGEPGTEDPGLGVLENREWVAGVLSKLPPAQREVMEMIAEGSTYEEIAGELGRSRDAIRRRVCDARARLIHALTPDGTEALTPGTSSQAPL